MRKKNGMDWIRDHECKATKDVDSPRISLFKHNGKERWFFVIDSEKHGIICNEILICPYCGAFLSGTPDEKMIPKQIQEALPHLERIYGKESLEWVPSADIKVHIDPTDIWVAKASEFTCYDCAGCKEHFKEGGGHCDFVFDPYNLQGDCLQSK